MGEFVKNIEALRNHVLVSHEFSFKNVKIFKPDVLLKYFLPFFSQSLIDQVESFETESNVIKKSSFEKFEKAISKFIVFEFLIEGQLTIQDGAVSRIESENSKTAYKNQVLDSRDQLEETGLSIIEDLIQLFDDNTAIFTDWLTSPLKKSTVNLFIKSASEFNEIERLYRKNTTFYSIVTEQETTIDLFIRSRFDSTLIDEIIENDSLTTEKKKFRAYLQKAVANFTIANSIKKNLVKLSRDGVRIIQVDKDTASKIESSADSTSIGMTFKSFMDVGHRYINLADNYKNSNLTAFGLTVSDTPFVKTKPWM